MSTPLWQEYLAYIKTWEERNPLDKGNKMTAIRKVLKGDGVKESTYCVPAPTPIVAQQHLQ